MTIGRMSAQRAAAPAMPVHAGARLSQRPSSDYSKPPLRQTKTAGRQGGGSELHVSMADPPALLYSAVRSAEWDRTFVTGLVGPGGKAGTTWRVSMVVKDGKVVKNTVTGSS